MADYTTLAAVQRLAMAGGADLGATLGAEIITAASRIFDRAVGVKDDFFAQAAGTRNTPTRSERVFYGEGTDYLCLDPFVDGNAGGGISANHVTMPDGFTVPSFLTKAEHDGFFLVRLYGASPAVRSSAFSENQRANNFGLNTPGYSFADSVGWPIGVPVTVNAAWGWPEVPADVAHATKEIALKIWREADSAFIKAVDLEGQTFNPQLPPTAKLIVDRWKAKRLHGGIIA